MNSRKILSGVLAFLAVTSDVSSASRYKSLLKDSVSKTSSMRSKSKKGASSSVELAKRRMNSVVSFTQNSKTSAQKTSNGFSPLTFWGTVGVLSTLTVLTGFVSYYATRANYNGENNVDKLFSKSESLVTNVNNQKDNNFNFYYNFADRLGFISKLKERDSLKEEYPVETFVKSIMPVYDELCLFASHLSLDFDKNKLEVKFKVRSTESEFYKSHVSNFKFLESLTYKFKIKYDKVWGVDRFDLDDVKCDYIGNYKWNRISPILKFKNKSGWKFGISYGCYYFLSQLYKIDHEIRITEDQISNFLDYHFETISRKLIAQSLFFSWIWPVFNNEPLFDCVLYEKGSSLGCDFIADLLEPR